MKYLKRLLITAAAIPFALTLAGMFNPILEENISKHEEYTTSSIPDSSITVLNWNIHKESAQPEWLTDFNSIMETYAPDIVALQEAQEHELFREALGGSAGYIFAANVADEEGTSSGVMTMSEATPVHYAHALSEYREPLFKTPKISLATTYRLTPSEKLLKVINVHGINFVNLKKFRTQMAAIEKTIREHTGPVVLLGDFNTWKEKRMAVLNGIAERHGLNQVQFTSEDKGHLKKFMNNTLDHIFFSDDLEIHSERSNVLEEVSSSDHKPMVVTFAVKQS